MAELLQLWLIPGWSISQFAMLLADAESTVQSKNKAVKIKLLDIIDGRWQG